MDRQHITCNFGQGLRHFTSEIAYCLQVKENNYFLSEKKFSKDGNALLIVIQAFVGRSYRSTVVAKIKKNTFSYTLTYKS